MIQQRATEASAGNGRRRSVLLFASAMLACVVPVVAAAQDTSWRPPDADAKIAALNAAGVGLLPLYVLGDVNEDGQVDGQDRDLIRRLVESGGDTQPSAEISCPAAADLNGNGSIDQRDVELISDWVKKGKLVAPALASSSYLPCNFKNFLLAASAASDPGGTFVVRFLDAALNASNTAVTVAGGPVEIAAAADGRGYIATIRSNASPGELVTLKIALPNSRAYLYTVTVGAKPR